MIKADFRNAVLLIFKYFGCIIRQIPFISHTANQNPATSLILYLPFFSSLQQ